jgi:hypothetical protein
MANQDHNFNWNVNAARATLGKADEKKFLQRLGAHCRGDLPTPNPDPPPLPFHQGKGNFQWDIATR